MSVHTERASPGSCDRRGAGGTPGQPPALAARPRLRTHDLEEAQVRIGEVLGAHQVRVASTGAHVDAWLYGFQLESVGLFSFGYGPEVLVTPEVQDSHLLVGMPLAGHVEVSQGRELIECTPEVASVQSLTRPTSIRWAEGRQLIARFGRPAMEAHLGRLLGRRPDRPLTFSLGMDLTRPPARSWRSLVELLRNEAEAGGGMLEQPLAVRQLEGLLMTQLLLTQPSNYSDALSGGWRKVAPPTVRRAVRLIEEHADEPLTVEDIAEAVGVSARALQEGFRRHLEKTPMGYLREVRLERAHAELAVRGPETATVTDVAYRWGFTHLGRFSLAYRQRFGESPSRTLRH
ncbi:AraC family transcriptional regulator [Microbispora amethystogenes]|uniref:AraC family transcriptional regulator n=1 Tax=Microbispora amethystogenes TaxID=1427754 RepID=A0ABQ4FFS2_9ACTN|nr:AraC family transcriptional regulator [Microbispora amethystogenes]GIH33594.1 AraC family transcriptional regulator [Microbispora amethystogenes]